MPQNSSCAKKEELVQSEALIALTGRAYHLAIAAAQSAADLILGASSALPRVVAYERELDELDREIDERVAVELVNTGVEQVREKLACLKCMIDLERIGDLLLSFATRADAVRARLDMQDLRDLGDMLSVLAKMLGDTESAFSARDHALALQVLRADREVDRLHNLIVMRHLEPELDFGGPDSVHVITMAQAIERAADHVKNTAEEVCHMVSGHTVRHLLRLHEKSAEQLYLEHLRRQHLTGGTLAE
jgi:phosphate transport system protein